MIRRRIERVDRSARLLGCLPGIRRRRRDRFAGLLHLLLRAAERLADLGRDQCVLPGGPAHLLQQPLEAFLDGALLGPEGGTWLLARFERVLYAELALRQPAGLRQGLVEVARDLLPPLLLHPPPFLLQLLAHRIELLSGPLALLTRFRPPPLLRRSAACRIWPDACCARSPTDSRRDCRALSPAPAASWSSARPSESARAANARSDAAAAALSPAVTC